MYVFSVNPGSSNSLLKCLREVVNNFQESGDKSKNATFFLLAPKDPYGELFSKIIFKSFSEFLFWQKIRKFEIGQNVPNLHNFYRAFSAFLQHSYKTTENYLVFIFHTLFFIPWNSFPTIFHLQLNFLSFVTTRVKYTIFSIPFVRWILLYFRRP